jgi:rare lipoprotein A
MHRISQKPPLNRYLQWLMTCSLMLLFLNACGTPAPDRKPDQPPPQKPGYPKPYKVLGKWYQPIPDAKGFKQSGLASWYGKKFHGRKTSSGEIYNMYTISAAHKTLPLGTYVRVHNLNNHKKLDVRINDRGPFVRGRIIDLSYKAAQVLDVVGPGTAPVEIVALGAALPEAPGDAGQRKYVPMDYYHGNFTFQVGAFTEYGNALRLKQKLDPIYKNAHITVYDRGDQVFYRVRVGHCKTLEQADQYESALIKNGFPDAFTVAE